MLNNYRSQSRVGELVFVYRNLTKSCWSIRSCTGESKDKVTGHASYFILQNATFKISEAGRQRVLLEKKKNVHAGIVGTLLCARYMDGGELKHPQTDCSVMWKTPDISTKVSYNPYRNNTFIKTSDGTSILSSDVVLGSESQVFAYPFERKNLGKINYITN